MNNTLKGKTVVAQSSGKYSMYEAVQGVVTRHANGFVTVKAKRVKVKGENWSNHPTHVMASAREGDVRVVEQTHRIPSCECEMQATVRSGIVQCATCGKPYNIGHEYA